MTRILPHVILSFVLAALVVAFAATGWRQIPADAACGTSACMTVDADPLQPGIQSSTERTVGTTFDISLEATNADQARGYQWEIQFSSATVGFLGAIENSEATGATLCVPASDASNPGPPGTTRIGNGAGCITESGTLPASARLTTITLTCLAAGTSSIHLVSLGEDTAFGSAFIDNAMFVATDLTDATIQCSAQPTATPTTTITPCGLECPLPAMTLDADPASDGVQAVISVAPGATFDVALEATHASQAAGYQWEIEFSAAPLNFVAASENRSGTGANLCAPPRDVSAQAPPGMERFGFGAGCIRESGQLPDTVLLTTITLQCDYAVTTPTVSPVHLVSLSEDAVGGSTFFTIGGAILATSLTDATVQCGVGEPVPTATPTIELATLCLGRTLVAPIVQASDSEIGVKSG